MKKDINNWHNSLEWKMKREIKREKKHKYKEVKLKGQQLIRPEGRKENHQKEFNSLSGSCYIKELLVELYLKKTDT